MIKDAVILAAGQGRRLWPFTQNVPKSLLDVGGESILECQVRALRSSKIDRITIVVGHRGDRIRTLLGDTVSYVENPDYLDTSSMYSLWLARDSLRAQRGFLVLNSDVLFHIGILHAVLDSPFKDALAVDFDAALNEEAMKVVVRDRRVMALGKELTGGHGENVGMVKVSAETNPILFSTIESLLESEKRQAMVPDAVAAIAQSCPIYAVPVDGLPWIEIDFPEDYRWARDRVYPALLTDMSCASKSPRA
jgi:choline kinase